MILFVMCLVIPLSLADNKNGLQTLDTGKLDVIETFDIDNDKANNDGQRKRDTGYSYPRPVRPIKFDSVRLTKGPSRYNTRLPANIVKPFNRYGPPKQTSLHVFLNDHQTLRPQTHRNKNRYHSHNANGSNIKFSGSKDLIGNSQLDVTNTIKGVSHSSQSNPIASQTEVAFDHNTANYLPPKNQKLPLYSSNSPQPFNNHINHQHSQRLIQNSQPQAHQLSDAAQFLTRNAQAISQLYETPAANLNYAPSPDDIDESVNNQSPNPNSQFQIFDMTSNQQSQSKQNSASFTGQLPSYSSGILESQRSLDKILAEEKDRLIAQLQQELTSQRQTSVPDDSRYTQNNGNYYETQKLLDKYVEFNNHGHQEAVSGADVQIGQTSFSQRIPLTSYGTPLHPVTNQTPSTISLTAPTASNVTPVQRPQSTAGTGSSHVPTLVSTPSGQPAPALPFPQYGSFVPTVIAATNFVSGLPPPYGTTFIGTNPSNSATHFNIPAGTTVNNKPISGSTPTIPVTQKPSTFPSISFSPPGDHSASLPIPLGHPISTNPIHPIFPIVPASIPLQKPAIVSNPPYGIQPSLVNSVILRPVKPVYPVYYYPNTALQLQKPAVAVPTYPWTYAPSYRQNKPNQSWK